MPNIYIITQVVLELTCAAMCLIAFFLTVLGKKTLAPSGILMAQMLMINIFLLLADAAAYAFRGNVSPTGILMTRASNYLVYLFQYITLLFIMLYLKALLKERSIESAPFFFKLQLIFCVLSILLVTISQFTGSIYYFDEQNLYHRNSGIAVTMALGLLCLLNALIMIAIYHRHLPRRQQFSLVTYLLFPILSVILQTLFYGISFMNICMTLTLMAVFTVHESERIRLMEEQALQLARQQEQLTEQRIQLITSQIHPHFLYNALATISSLCQPEPATAEMAVNRFAEYLRMNLDSLNNASLIPFTKELEHSKTYLWLEYLRFGDILKVEYDIRFTDFFIPPLVMQPIVENAVKHGIFPKEEGGTVYISTRRLENGIEIRVRDDGVGFDPLQQPDNHRSHIGITNVRSRLEALCHGTLTIQSHEDAGTTVTIFLPEGGLSDEDSVG